MIADRPRREQILEKFTKKIVKIKDHQTYAFFFPGIYKLALSHSKLGITKEVIATKVLPFLIPLCVENGLTLNQFNALISLVKQMISKMETEHRAKLEQLNSINNETK